MQAKRIKKVIISFLEEDEGVLVSILL